MVGKFRSFRSRIPPRLVHLLPNVWSKGSTLLVSRIPGEVTIQRGVWGDDGTPKRPIAKNVAPDGRECKRDGKLQGLELVRTDRSGTIVEVVSFISHRPNRLVVRLGHSN